MFRLRLKFTKDASIRYLSHLDTIALLERMIRRAELPVMFSQGFSPRMKLSVAWPLSVGMSSRGELADVWLEQWIAPDKVVPLLNSVAAPGCRILSAELVHLREPALTEQVRAAVWAVPAADQPTDQPSEQVTLPAGPRENVRIQDQFPKTAWIERIELVLNKSPL
jgi:radical SAM-linked protein